MYTTETMCEFSSNIVSMANNIVSLAPGMVVILKLLYSIVVPGALAMKLLSAEGLKPSPIRYSIGSVNGLVPQ